MEALRSKVVATVADGVADESADVTAVLRDGRSVHVFVEHAIGSLQRPMSDADLQAKFTHLVAPVLGDANVKPLIDACRTLADAPDVGALVALARAR
jgi:hypothetical protein